MHGLRWVFIFIIGLLCSVAQAAETLSADHVKLSWIVPDHFTGEVETIGIRFEIDPHWHIYWKNPGDSGTAPKFKFTSDQVDLSPPAWPVPSRIPVSSLTNLGYEKIVVFPFLVTPRPASTATEIGIKADLEWLVCQEECLPGSGQLSLKRPVAKGKAQWIDGDQLDRSLQKIPQFEATSPWIIDSMTAEGDELKLSLHSKNASSLSDLQIFPVTMDVLSPAAPRVSDDGKSLAFKILGGNKDLTTLSFVIAETAGAWEISPKLEAANQSQTAAAGTVTDEGKPQEKRWITYIILLLSAFVGGIILNLMPCVLPVLSIKFFSLAKVSPRTRWREAMLYTLGVLITFTALGALFLGLRAGGAAIGWGFQLQSPPIVTALIVLFWLMGLSFLGFFEFGNSLTRAAGKFENTGSFATGCLSVFVATPCTGPFMGTALGAAATLPAFQAILIFFALGLGLASPFLALACFPSIKLPKPGMWMITLRQFLAFPLFATVVWLLWVLAMQIGSDAWLYLSSLGLLLTFAVWIGKDRGPAFKIVGLLLAVVGISFTGKWVITAPLVAAAKNVVGTVTWIDYDAQVIKDAVAKKQAVFVDFTASWCVTCQVNKKAVLETDAAEKIFAENNVLLIRGDWTNLDEKITTALAAFGRASVPLYLYYPPDGGKPQILPQI
ncbi:MAG: thioredoxin family protein, partial [Oligoflexus sp.]|nr:thioredoxin family protein [Oligoflexus sp.]